jgi:hypothetical protein
MSTSGRHDGACLLLLSAMPTYLFVWIDFNDRLELAIAGTESTRVELRVEMQPHHCATGTRS